MYRISYEANHRVLCISAGQTSCVGKNLALTEIRMVTARLLSAFDISFQDGDNGESVERDMRDQLTANPGDLRLVFEPRERSST